MKNYTIGLYMIVAAVIVLAIAGIYLFPINQGFVTKTAYPLSPSTSVTPPVQTSFSQTPEEVVSGFY